MITDREKIIGNASTGKVQYLPWAKGFTTKKGSPKKYHPYTRKDFKWPEL